MTQAKAEMILDSVDKRSNRLSSIMATMPRYLLAEFNTHRALSRNSASSRAIPFRRLLDSVSQYPFVPMAWMKDHPGMQGTEYITDPDTIKEAKRIWLQGKSNALDSAQDLNRLGVTKQMANRKLEPYMWHTVLVSATEWANFLHLRCPQYIHDANVNGKSNITYHRSRKAWNRYSQRHVNDMLSMGGVVDSRPPETELAWLLANKGAADIHMMAVAEAIYDCIAESTPKLLQEGEWHIPFGDNLDEDLLKEIFMSDKYLASPIDGNTSGRIGVMLKIATARCARTSYITFGQDPKVRNYIEDVAVHDKLVTGGHWSPFEHCAQVMTDDQYGCFPGNGHYKDGHAWHENGWSANYRGFIQYRKMFSNENVNELT